MKAGISEGAALPQVIICGNVNVPSPNKHFERKPSEYILYVITGGRMLLHEGDVFYDLREGDCLLLTPDQMHYGDLCFSDISYIYIHFTWKDFRITDMSESDYQAAIFRNRLSASVSSAEDAPFIFPKFSHIGTGALSEFSYLFRSINSEQNRKEPHYILRSSLLLFEALIQIQRASMPDSGSISSTVNALLEFLQKKSSSSIGSTQIEEAFHMNFDYLNRLFKKHTGTTLMKYHEACRINEAQRLLRTGMYTVSQVSDILGYNNAFYFSRVFKRETGIPPSSII